MTGVSTSDEDEDDLLELPGADDPGDEEVGVADAEELLFDDLADEPEEVGLDTDPLGAGELGLGLQSEDDDEQGLLDDSPIEIDADIDAGDEEHGWTEDSEGTAGEGWDDELPDELAEQGLDDDAGEEGVEDPLLDGLPEERLPSLGREDEEDDDDDSWAEEVLPRERGAGA